jgi:hypothetical protein
VTGGTPAQGGTTGAAAGAGGGSNQPVKPSYDCPGLEPETIDTFANVRVCDRCVLQAERRSGHYANGTIGVCWAFEVRDASALDSTLDNWAKSVICTRGDADNCATADAAIESACCQ